MALRGSLTDVNLADICQLLAMGRKSGCLWVTDRTSFGYVYFDAGKVVSASVLHRPDRLGELLVQNGVISREDLSGALERQGREPGLKLGKALVDAGAVTPDELKRYIEIQVSEAVYHLFAWTKGTFHFDPDRGPEDEVESLVSINAENLLLEGARRIDEWGLIEKKIPSFDLVFSVTRDPVGDDIELTEAQRRVLPLIDGERSVDEVVAGSGMVEFEVGKAMFGLLQAGYLEQTGRREGGAPETPETRAERHAALGEAFVRAGLMDESAREFRRVIELHPEHPAARRGLAALELMAGRPEGALEHYAMVSGDQSRRYATLRNRALAFERLGRWDEALGLLDQAEALQPEDPDLFLARGAVLIGAGQAEAAAESFLRYRERAGDAALTEPYYAYAVVSAAMNGDPDAAARLGREGLERFPESGPILVNTGAALELCGELEAAEVLYRRATRLEQPPVQAYKCLGDLAFLRGDLPDARSQYERVIERAPHLGDDTYARLAGIAEEHEEPSAAIRYWERALELNPDNPQAVAGVERLARS